MFNFFYFICHKEIKVSFFASKEIAHKRKNCRKAYIYKQKQNCPFLALRDTRTKLMTLPLSCIRTNKIRKCH